MNTIPLRTRADEIRRYAEIGARLVLKELKPLSDELSIRQAYNLYGRRWITQQMEKGNLKGHRKGAAQNSPIILSRVDIECLREAEMQEAEIQIREVRRVLEG